LGLGPVVPPPSPWSFPDLTGPEADAFDDLIGAGADLEPGTLLDAYSRGFFPMPGDNPRGPMTWWSPVHRGVLPLDGLRVSRSLRQSARRFEIRFDSAFAEVVAGCGDPRRDGAWIDHRIAAAYLRLHELGWAHSVETRDADGNLVGGLYGIQVGRLFAGESMFHLERDASKVALIALVELQAGGLIDVQWSTNHLASLGVITLDRWDYLRRLPALVDQPPPAWPRGTR